MAQLLFYYSARVHASRTQTGLSRGSSWPLYIMSANAVRHEVALGASSQLGWLTWLHSDWMVWLGSYQGGFTCHHQLGFWVLLPLSTWFLCDLSSKMAQLLTWQLSASKNTEVEAARPWSLGITLAQHHFYCTLKQVTGAAQIQGVENKKSMNLRRCEPSVE